MNAKNLIILTLLSAAITTAGTGFSPPAFAAAQAQSTGQPAIAKRIGAIKAINGNSITLAPESGPEVAVTVQANARLLRMAPGDKDLKNAAPIQLQDLQAGDTIRVRGYASDDAKSLTALEVIVITHSALDTVRDQIRQDWQKRGLGGLVRGVDPATGTVTISAGGLGGSKTIAIHTAGSTVVRRYAPDSVKFEDAKPSKLQAIHLGDQLRARGNRSADGGELTAEEIVSGTFPNIEGTVKSVDATAGTLSVQDAVTRKTLQVRITADSQLHKIPAEMAQRFAARIKSMLPPGIPGAAASSSASATPAAAGAGGGGMNGGGPRSGGAPDLQQILTRLPSSTLADLNLQKGDAVFILATEGTPASASTAITLLSGVEPILEATPKGSQAMMLAPWSLGGAPGGDASQ